MQLNFAAREVTIKLVYYGPALSGKTTNLKALHELTSEESHGRLMTLETRDDRTLFFDMLPLVFKSENGDMSVTLNLSVVAGSVTRSRAAKTLWTDAQQKLVSSTDDFCRQVQRLANGLAVVWPNY